MRDDEWECGWGEVRRKMKDKCLERKLCRGRGVLFGEGQSVEVEGDEWEVVLVLG